MPLSRRDRVPAMAKLIGRLDMGDYEKELLIVCDNINIPDGEIQYFFKDIKYDLIYTGNAEPTTLDMRQRRQRITNCWVKIAEFLNDRNELVLGVEDDGDFRKGDFLKLLDTFKEKFGDTLDNCGFISGVEAGRWGWKMIGAWRREFSNDSEKVKTVPFKDDGIEEVDAAGLYFFLTTAKTIVSVQWQHKFFGPDWYFGMQLREMEFQNYIDYSIKLGHNNGVMPIYVDDRCVVIEYVKVTDSLWKLTSPAPS